MTHSSLPGKYDLAFTNALILTMNPQGDILHHATLLISGNTIAAVLPQADEPLNWQAETTIDAGGKLLMPGLINAHGHAAMTIYRGYADDMPLHRWLNQYIFPVERQFSTRDNIVAGTQLAIAEMLLSGTTCFCDMYYFEHEIARLADSSGIRAVLAEGILDFPTPNMKSPADGLDYTADLIEEYRRHPRITIAVGPHAPYTCTPALLRQTKDLARRYDVPWHIHLAETQWEMDYFLEHHGCTPLAHLNTLDLLDSRSCCAHSICLTDDDIERFALTGASVAHNPECNMKLASGVAPISKLRLAGVPVGIGTDGVASNNNLDMFQEIRTAAFLHKLWQNDPAAADAQTMLRMATSEAAKALGMDHLIGSIETGKRADLILIDLNKPHLTPLYNVYSQVVYCMSGSDVDTVVVDGKILVREAELQTFSIQTILNEVRLIAGQIEAFGMHAKEAGR